MIIEKLENLYREDANRLNGIPRNVFRASSSGYCERRLGYEKLGVKGEPLTPRRAAVFRHGHTLDAAMKADLQEVLGDKFVNPDEMASNHCMIEGVKVTFTPDGLFQNALDIGIIEIKTMSDWAFERALKGEIDRSYLCQAWVYHYGTSFNPVVFICYRKETSHLCEIVFDRNAEALVVTQRFGGDAQELYTQDPLLVAEIKTPFDSSVEREVRGKFRRLSQVKSESDLVVGVREMEDETIKVQGGKAREAYAHAHPGATEGQRKGAWYSFNTGRTIAKFPCSYCGFIEKCLSAKLEFTSGNKPIWVIDKKLLY